MTNVAPSKPAGVKLRQHTSIDLIGFKVIDHFIIECKVLAIAAEPIDNFNRIITAVWEDDLYSMILIQLFTRLLQRNINIIRKVFIDRRVLPGDTLYLFVKEN